MPDTHPLSQRPDTPIEDRFLSWMDTLVDPAMEIPVPDRDIADIAGTAAFIQQVAGIDGTAALAPGRADTMWEDIMSTTTATLTNVPTLPASGSTPPLRPGRPVTMPSPGWRNYLATALLIATIVIGSLATVWRIAGPFDFGGSGSDNGRANQPGIIGIASPSPGTPSILDAQEFASPVATPETETPACDLSGDVPIVMGLDAPSWSDTALILSDGTLMLQCDGTNTVVADGVTEAQGTTWPGTVLLKMEDDTLRGINLLTGAGGALGPASLLQSATVGPQSRWLGIPANEQSTDWRFIDLETMESLLLSDVLGGVLPRPTVSRPYAWTSDAVVIGFPGTPVGAQGPSTNPLDRVRASTPADSPTSALPFENAALVIDGSLANSRWTEISHRARVSSAISPDGELLAVEEMTDDALTIRVERLADGELIAETGIDYGAGDSMVVLNDGAGLLHLTSDRLDLVTWDDQGTVAVQTLIELEARQDMPVLVHTADPGIILVGTTGSDGESVGYLVDVGGDSITEVPDLLSMPFIYVQYIDGVPPRYVLAAGDAGQEQSVVRMIDVTTGEAVLESDPVDLPLETTATEDAALRDGGRVGFVFLADGDTIVLNAEFDETFTVQPPEGNGPWIVLPSPTGTFLTARSETARSAFVRAVTPEASWKEVDADTPIGLLIGTDSPLNASAPN